MNVKKKQQFIPSKPAILTIPQQQTSFQFNSLLNDQINTIQLSTFISFTHQSNDIAKGAMHDKSMKLSLTVPDGKYPSVNLFFFCSVKLIQPKFFLWSRVFQDNKNDHFCEKYDNKNRQFLVKMCVLCKAMILPPPLQRFLYIINIQLFCV